jgi:site-specific DNA-methyltransferase (adenine-specific)
MIEKNLINKIHAQNCIEGMKALPEKSVHLIVTDPPFKTITGGNSNGKNSIRPKGMLDGNRKLFNYQNNIKIKDWIFELFRVLKDNSHCYIFTNSLNLKEMIIESEGAGFKLHNVLVWEKNNCTPSQYYMKNCEYIIFLRKGKAKWINDIGGSKTVHKFNNIIGNKHHPTEKPTNLLEFYVKNSSNEGELVLDPFMGSGSTAIACINTNRNYIGFEIDNKYIDVIEKRIKEHEKN